MSTKSPRGPFLPTELWYAIIYMLPSLDQTTCLSVSKTFHDIATTYVFSHVTICLGLWQPFECDSEDDVPGTEEKAATKRQANLSYDNLRHMIHTPDFAKKVTKISVHAFSSAGEEMQIAIRKSHFSCTRRLKAQSILMGGLLGFLVDAPQTLPELRSFVRYGIGPIIPTDILKALVNSAGGTLREFCIP